MHTLQGTAYIHGHAHGEYLCDKSTTNAAQETKEKTMSGFPVGSSTYNQEDCTLFLQAGLLYQCNCQTASHTSHLPVQQHQQQQARDEGRLYS
jgi:hypothetical protein